eukprot:s356_g17.t3
MEDGSALEYFPEELKKDRELVYKALQQKGTALEFASAFWDDKMLVTAAVKNDPAAFQWASQDLRADRDLWLQACPKRMEHWKNRVEVQKEVQEEGTVLSMADPLVLKDEEVIFEAAVQNPRVLECLDLDRSEDFLLRLARQDLNALRYADIQSREVAQKALEISGLALEFFPEELKADKELVLEAVGRAGMALAFAAPELRNDREVVLRAVAADRSALLHASPELRRDKAIWLYKGAAVPFFEPPKEEEEVEEVNDPAEGEETAVEAAEGQVAEEVLTLKLGRPWARLAGMAYGLRKIVGTTYFPYGNGRDWFFVGDLDYMHGRRTPEVYVRQRMEKQTPARKKKGGVPKDVVFTQAKALQTRCVSVPSVPGACGYEPQLPLDTLNRWRRIHASDPGGSELEHWRQQPAANREADEINRSKCSATLRATTSRNLSLETRQLATSMEFGSKQNFNAFDPRMGDKYRSFSNPSNDPSRFDFIAQRVRAERAEREARAVTR